MTAPTPQSEAKLEPPPPPVLAPPTTANPPPPPPELPSRALPPIPDGIVMLGGLMIFGFSFAPFLTYSGGRNSEQSASSWEWAPYLAPLTWFVILGGLLLLVLGLRHALSGDRRLLTFRASQLQLIVAAYSASILIGYALTEKKQSGVVNLDLTVLHVQGGLTISAEFAWGGVLMLVGALVALVGALLNLLRLPAFSGTRFLEPGRRP